MGLIVFLAVVGALVIYAFQTLFDAPVWGFVVALVLFILGMNASNRAGIDDRQAAGVAVGNGGGTQRLFALRNGNAAFVATIAAFAGIGLGWLLAGFGEDELSARSFVTVENGLLIATAPLKAMLETVPSSDTLGPLAGKPRVQFRAKMTFQNASRDYCRQYELASGMQERMAGIACRTAAGNWSVVLQSPQPPYTAARTVPASGQNAVLDAAVDALIQGNPLAAEAEATVIRSGWRK
jgi:hypothetical protein